MHQPETRMQSRRHDRAGNTGAQDRIAIVQKPIDTAAILVAAEFGAEQQWPIAPGGFSFDILRVA